MSDPPNMHLVRIGPPSKGDVIHRDDCRVLSSVRGRVLPWKWADLNPGVDWQTLGTGLKACKACKPPSPACGLLLGKRVDTPFGLGTVREIGFHPELIGGPYVTVDLEAKGMTFDDEALLDLADVELFDERHAPTP